jgi:hypothetical protein
VEAFWAAVVSATSYSTEMDAQHLWVESYQGEVLGEALFGLLALREEDLARRHQLDVLTLLERATKELADPLFEARAFDRGDTAATVEAAAGMADAVACMTWEEFLGSFEPVITQFLARYRQLVELATDNTERKIAEAYVAHEEALAVFVRRALGQEPGEPLQAILGLPHVAAAIRS